MTTIIIPTIREEHIRKFLEAWQDQFEGQRVIVVEDHPTKQFSLEGVEHYSHEDISVELDDDEWIISKGTSAVRNFGTFKAMQQATDMIWHLDDDCMPHFGDELEKHHSNLYQTHYPLPRWFSTDETGNHLRGMPYKNVDTHPEFVVSHGTWLKNPDYDAIHQLANRFEFSPKAGYIPLGRYFPMCGMNLAFTPEVAPAMYFAPKDERYNRNDDIWMGIVAKRVFDRLRLYCYTGYPQIVHDRASDPFKNLIAEGPFIEANEGFWQYIDEIEIKGNTLKTCLKEVAQHMQQEPYRGEKFFVFYGSCLERWVDIMV